VVRGLPFGSGGSARKAAASCAHGIRLGVLRRPRLASPGSRQALSLGGAVSCAAEHSVPSFPLPQAEGRTALDAAIESGRHEVAEYLQRKAREAAAAAEAASFGLPSAATPSRRRPPSSKRSGRGRRAIASPLSPASVNVRAGLSASRRRKTPSRLAASAASLGVGSPAL